jgi:Zn-dependent M16 (insulinase) family peptidase
LKVLCEKHGELIQFLRAVIRHYFFIDLERLVELAQP